MELPESTGVLDCTDMSCFQPLPEGQSILIQYVMWTAASHYCILHCLEPCIQLLLSTNDSGQTAGLQLHHSEKSFKVSCFWHYIMLLFNVVIVFKRSDLISRATPLILKLSCAYSAHRNISLWYSLQLCRPRCADKQWIPRSHASHVRVEMKVMATQQFKLF